MKGLSYIDKVGIFSYNVYMTYNIHPLLVHFPIALLFLYSVIKILPFQKFIPSVAWKDIERALLFFGFLGSLAAFFTGGIAEHLVQPNHQLVEMHSNFALLSVIIYGVLLLYSEVFSFLKPSYARFSDGIVAKILALAGLICISITGMLGGVMVYGLSADPLAPLVLRLLGINL